MIKADPDLIFWPTPVLWPVGQDGRGQGRLGRGSPPSAPAGWSSWTTTSPPLGTAGGRLPEDGGGQGRDRGGGRVVTRAVCARPAAPAWPGRPWRPSWPVRSGWPPRRPPRAGRAAALRRHPLRPDLPGGGHPLAAAAAQCPRRACRGHAGPGRRRLPGGCSATHWPTRTCSARPPEPALAPPWPSPTAPTPPAGRLTCCPWPPSPAPSPR